MKINLAILAVAAAGTAQAQAPYPVRPIRLICAFAPGGATDFLARQVAQQISTQLGQSVTVDNRPGAGGVIGTEIGARAAPDGYTLTAGSSGGFTVAPHMVPKLPYDPTRDFAPVGTYASFPYVLIVHPSVPAQSLKALLALAKAQPGKLNFGSAGNASGNHLAMEQLMWLGGIRMTHVPFKGGILALTALIAGEIDVAFDPMITTLAQLKARRVRALAVSTLQRSALLPQLPTTDEAGVKGYNATNWSGILVPVSTPRPIIERLNGAINAGMTRPDVRERLIAQGAEPLTGTPQALAELIARESARTGKIIAAAGLVKK
jgi:tripartite-type tricarboxylate transporter receptor subunit TctC